MTSAPASKPPASSLRTADPGPQAPAQSGTARPLLLHVGYHKTATTWLQNIVFTPEHGFCQVMDHDAIFDHVIAPHGLAFDPAPARALIAEGAAGAAPGAAVDVVSLEALSGLPYTGGRESDDYARRLAAITADRGAPVTVLMTIREQTAILSSVYMQYLYRAGTESPRRFFDEDTQRGFFRFSAENFCYHRLVGLYQALFGPENVLVLPQELIAADQAAAVRLMAEVAGNAPLLEAGWAARTERGKSYPQYAVPLLRRANYFRREALNPSPMIDLGRLGQWGYRGTGWLARRAPLPKSLTGSKPVTEYIRERFDGRFAESNRALAAQLHHKVALPGYQGL